MNYIKKKIKYGKTVILIVDTENDPDLIINLQKKLQEEDTGLGYIILPSNVIQLCVATKSMCDSMADIYEAAAKFVREMAKDLDE